MRVTDWLMSAGGKLGLLRFVSTTAAVRPHKVPTRTVRLSDLITEIRKDEVNELAQQPMELSQSFDKVFGAAGITTPEHGWTIQRLKETLDSGRFKGQSRQDTQKALLEMLAADKAHVQDLARDAVARDGALDAFEIFVQAKMEGRDAARRRKAAAIEAHINGLQAELAQLKAEAGADEAAWKTWHERKVACERDMSWALSFLLDKPAVSVDNDPPAKVNSFL